MNIDRLADICTQFPDVRVVAINDEQLDENYNSGYGSWRGSYNEPALFFNGDGYITLKDLLPYLDKLASDEEFEGYKGVFICMLGMFLTLILLMYKDLAEETFVIFKDAFVKSVESKSPLELAIWSMVLIVIMLTPVLKKIFK